MLPIDKNMKNRYTVRHERESLEQSVSALSADSCPVGAPEPLTDAELPLQQEVADSLPLDCYNENWMTIAMHNLSAEDKAFVQDVIARARFHHCKPGMIANMLANRPRTVESILSELFATGKFNRLEGYNTAASIPDDHAYKLINDIIRNTNRYLSRHLGDYFKQTGKIAIVKVDNPPPSLPKKKATCGWLVEEYKKEAECQMDSDAATNHDADKASSPPVISGTFIQHADYVQSFSADNNVIHIDAPLVINGSIFGNTDSEPTED